MCMGWKGNNSLFSEEFSVQSAISKIYYLSYNVLLMIGTRKTIKNDGLVETGMF